jgi:hypothetical protein
VEHPAPVVFEVDKDGLSLLEPAEVAEVVALSTKDAAVGHRRLALVAGAAAAVGRDVGTRVSAAAVENAVGPGAGAPGHRGCARQRGGASRGDRFRRRVTRVAWSTGQRLGLQQLRDIAEARPAAFEIIKASAVGEGGVSMRVEVSIDTSGIAHAAGGIQVRARERFVLLVGPRFPYVAPLVWVRHRRWAGTAHVQWGSSLCLYAAPSVEWSPGEGMRGLIERLLLWVEQAAAGQLDPDDRPLHPPTTYTGSSGFRIVMRADLGELVPWSGEARSGAVCLVGDAEIQGSRIDVLSWHPATAGDSDEPQPDQPGRFGLPRRRVLPSIDLRKRAGRC